jgi:hypothetical protein
MPYEERHRLDNAMQLLSIHYNFLIEKAKNDPDLKDLAEMCSSAEACLSDYLDEYDRQFSKED